MIDDLRSSLALLVWLDPAAAALLLLAARGTIVVALAAALTAILGRRASAALRRQIWALTSLALLALAVVAVSELAAIEPGNRWVQDGRGVAAQTSGSPPALTGGPTASTWLLAWALGAAPLLVRLLLAHGAAAALGRRSRAVADPAWRSDARRAARELGAATPDLRATASIVTPLTIGLLRPLVLIPHGMLSVPADQRRAVLLHEIAHVRRRDVAVRTAAGMACAMHWFNPLAWVVARRLNLESERAGDDAVLSAGVSPACYARLLVGLASRPRGPVLSPAVASGLGASELLRRVEAIGDRELRRREPPSAVVAAISCAAGLVCLAVLQLYLPRPELHFIPAPSDLARVPAHGVPAEAPLPTSLPDAEGWLDAGVTRGGSTAPGEPAAVWQGAARR